MAELKAADIAVNCKKAARMFRKAIKTRDFSGLTDKQLTTIIDGFECACRNYDRIMASLRAEEKVA
jgi:hypothetical protein